MTRYNSTMAKPMAISTQGPNGRSVSVAATAFVAASAAVAAEAEEKFLEGLRSDDEEANYAAWSTAGDMDPSVIPAVSGLLTSKKPNVRKAAEESLNNIVHSVGKVINPASLAANTGRPDDPGRMDRRQQVVSQLRSVLTGKTHRIEKVAVLRHLSLIGTSDDVASIASFISNPELREEVAFCLERIPGKSSEEALLAALPSASEDFKPRILAALGHRRADESAGACADAMASPDAELAMAGMKAWARIGTDPGTEVQFPERDGLSGWQDIEFDDSMLRYADARFEKGETAEATGIYMEVLARSEEHLQCAAMIGLANVGTAEAAAAIYPKLRSPDDKVRITARNAWARLADSPGDEG